MEADPEYQTCARAHDGGCDGRITYEHAFTYSGRQIQARWAILPLCFYHHLGRGLDKRKNRFLALRRATAEDLQKVPRLLLNQYK
jgi:hypothetical protein